MTSLNLDPPCVEESDAHASCIDSMQVPDTVAVLRVRLQLVGMHLGKASGPRETPVLLRLPLVVRTAKTLSPGNKLLADDTSYSQADT